MLRLPGRVWTVTVIVATLLLPAVGSLAETSLEQLRDRREAIQKEIEAGESKAKGLEGQRDELNRSLVKLRHEVAKLDARLADVLAEVRSVQAQIDKKQRQISKIRTIATEQARSLYMSGQADVLDALLDAKSLTELDDRIAMMDVAAQDRTEALINYSRLKAEIEEHHRILYAKKTELEGTKKEREKYQELLDTRKVKLTDILHRLQKGLRAKRAVEERLSDKIDKKVRALLAQQQSSGFPTGVIDTGSPSAQGYIWPLNGAITSPYGPRWGRMHTGIDIDGTSGQPIIASKAGRVILASYYYGYGNAVIIDHGGGYATLYGHMSAFGVSRGQVVAQGQVVGRVGCTGSCTGDHLHFEVRVNGSPRDPMIYLP